MTFLGPVHLLAVNETLIAHGSTINLENKKYSITMLDSREAMTKYGDKGNRGAVEINAID